MTDLSRRDLLKLSGVAVGAVALGSTLSGCGADDSYLADSSQRNSLADGLQLYTPGTEKLGADEMRITFLGTSCIPRLSQECNSIFVEVGSGDQFVFDCGSGVVAKYNAMGIPMSKMDKIFLTHLHGDHTSDLAHIYCFGPAEDRKSPLYLWGPGNSGVTYYDPQGNSRGPFNDGLRAFCENFREMMRWHTESFSFGATRYTDERPNPPRNWGIPLPNRVGGTLDHENDGYALYPIELDWTKSGEVDGDNIAYHNPTTGVKITHFPVIHCRNGSIAYKLEWNGMSMIFSGDTKPTNTMINQARGVDILIHEMVVPAEVWATKNSGIKKGEPGFERVYNYAKAVQESSHTPQGAFGYMLSQINPPPRLAIATHFQAADDTIASATRSVRQHYPKGDFTFASDLMVFNVTRTHIKQRKALVSDFAFYPPSNPDLPVALPLYWTVDDDGNPVMDPHAQIDRSDELEQKNPDGSVNWEESGY